MNDGGPGAVDANTPAFDHFTWSMKEYFCEVVPPLDDDHFWTIITEIEWPCHPRGPVDELARRLAKAHHLDIMAEATAAVYDKHDEVMHLLGDQAAREVYELIPSEDGIEDFSFHIVGMGRAFCEELIRNPEPALKIARDGLYVESLKYVFDEAFHFYPYADYVNWIATRGNAVTVEMLRDPSRHDLVDLGGGLYGVIARRDPAGILVVTPVGDQMIRIPG